MKFLSKLIMSFWGALFSALGTAVATAIAVFIYATACLASGNAVAISGSVVVVFYMVVFGASFAFIQTAIWCDKCR